jgi:hypothetical protein
MRILVLEDNSTRVNYFVEKYGNNELTITENAYDAINLLKEEVYDVIFLDNDLGYPENGHGVDVAKFLYENSDNENNNSYIVIHSWNTPAIERIQSYLPEAECAVYGSSYFFELELDNVK